MSLPVIPIIKGMLVMPLVGEITRERAGDIIPRLLDAIEQEHARVALIDITGVPIVDRDVAQALLNATIASQLLGTKVILVGISPEIAQTLVHLNLQLDSIQTASTLQEGVILGTRLLKQLTSVT
jgi:anti-anti-sigma regulatory factor